MPLLGVRMRSGQVNIQQAVAVLYVGAVLGDIHCKAHNAYRNGSCLPSRRANKIVASLGRVYVVCQSGLLSFLRGNSVAHLVLTGGERVTANKAARLAFLRLFVVRALLVLLSAPIDCTVS